MNETGNCRPEEISHTGTIQRSDRQNHYVLITSASACAGCHARGACHLNEVADKIIEVSREKDDFECKPGEKVRVIMENRLGLHAVLLGYIVPFCLLLAALIVTHAITRMEGLSALIALGTLLLYYLILYRFRHRLRKKFEFRIEK
ncbi:MAG: SoxR reducing system RseC family protein [Bacteroidales bacterium]|nr:SoxR reducing system RseC family protein [Bacteroidales bacterium]